MSMTDCERCAHCGNVFSQADGGRESKRPVTSQTCEHSLCAECIREQQISEEARKSQGKPTSLPWLNCPLCWSSFAFHEDALSTVRSQSTTPSVHLSTPYEGHYNHGGPVSTHSLPTSPSFSGRSSFYMTPHHYHHHFRHPPASKTTPFGATVHVSPTTPTQDSYPPHHRQSQAYVWRQMDYSPSSSQSSAGPYASPRSLPIEFHPPAHPGLVPFREVRSPEMPPRYPVTSNPSHFPRSPIKSSSSSDKRVIPRKRLRSPMPSKQSQLQVSSPDQEQRTSHSVSDSSHWLVCRICDKPVQVTCQRLLSGPPPDHETLWPQVRLGKRLAASLRLHNQQYHPDVFMWNVKGRAAMTNVWTAEVDDEASVAQTALLKALEAGFEHLPHVAGVDEYESKSVFLSRVLRRIGFAYAYISYTSSEWTKWQQWKKDSYSRVHIQAKARQLLDQYESCLIDAIEHQWDEEISTFTHQRKLDLFQNIFVLPQTIFSCLNHEGLPVQYDGVLG